METEEQQKQQSNATIKETQAASNENEKKKDKVPYIPTNQTAEADINGFMNAVLIFASILLLVAIIVGINKIEYDVEWIGWLMIIIGVFNFIIVFVSWAFLKVYTNISTKLTNIYEELHSKK